MALNKERKAAMVEDIENFKKWQVAEGIRTRMEEKNRFKNLRRHLQAQRLEIESDVKSMNMLKNEAIKERQMEEQEKLAIAVDKLKRDEVRELKLRQQLRENSQELRELESKLRSAYVSKELAAQIAEKQAEKLRQQIEEQQAYDRVQNAFVPLDEMKKSMAEAELKKKSQYRQELQDQMIQHEKIKRYKYEEFLREKKMLDDIIQRMHDEDERELQNKWCKMLKTREDMDSFKQAQQVWRQRMKAEIEEENRKIQEYLLAKATAEAASLQARQDRDAIKAQISERIAKQIYAEESKRKEREEIILALLEEEQKEAVERRHRQEVEKELRNRVEVRESLTRQMKEKEDRQKQEALEDAKYKEQIIAKYVEDLKLEQLSDQKRRLKMIQLRKDVEEMIQQRKQQDAEEMQLNMVLLKQAEEESKERQRLIGEERIKMLKEHAHRLIGFIPPGVLEPEDLPHLGNDVMEAYGKKN